MSKSNIFLSFLPHKNHPNHKLKPEVNSLTVSNSTLLEDNKKMIKEYLTKTKFSSPKFLNNVSSQNHNSNYFSLSKNKIDNSKSGYLISSLKIDGKPEISIPTITKNLNHCDIQINIQKEKIRFNVDCANKTSNSLVEILFVKIKEFYQQSKKNSELNQKPIIGFSTSSGFILIDYILTLNNIKLEFLQNMIIVFNPIYADIHFLKMKSTRISLKHFEFLKLIGSGGFSKVFLVRSKLSGKYHAMKLIDRDFIKNHQKEGIVMNERNILTSINHPNIIKLDYAFKSKQYIVFVMEFCAGGELFYHLKRFKRMTENEARLYFLELCLGIKHLHEKFIVYRDIKPENILLDIDGHLKIADFGLAKPNMDILKKAHSFCGSPEYMAPEMLQKKGHDYSVDYYCLGAILYELVIGSPPFYTTHTSEMFDRILSEEVAFPQDLDLSDEIIDLISNLLIKNPKYRRGSMGGVKEIMAHPWCKKMNIKDIEGKKIETPVKPNVFEFYVDEVSDDGELSNKMKDIYDEAFDELSEEDENERQFKNFYYESENIDVNKILKQRMPSSDSKAKHFLSNPDFSIVNQKILKQQNDEKIYQDIKELMNELHAKKNLSDNFHIQNQSTSYQSEILNDKINSINQDVNKNNGPYFIADQYRKKAPDSLTNLNAYSSYLKQQRSLEYQLSTSQKEKYLAEKKHIGFQLSQKKTNIETNYNILAKFQPYIPVNKNYLKKYKDKQNLSKEGGVFFTNLQKLTTVKKTPLNISPSNISITNTSHIKKNDILSSINLVSLLKFKQKENIIFKKNGKNNIFDEKFSTSASRIKMNTEPNSCSDWNNKEILIEDAKNCKGKLKMLGKKMKVSSIKKADEKKFFRD